MAIDKSQSPAWVRITVWVTIFAFVATVAGYGIFQAIQSFGNNGATTNGGQQTAGIESINAVYEPQVTAIRTQLDASPEDINLLTSLGTTYMNWAYALYNSTDPAAQAQFEPTMAASLPYWEKAYELDSESKEIGGDYSTALYYGGQPELAISTARTVLEQNPEYATVWYNLGIYLTNSGDTAGATEAFNNAIQYDADGTVTEAAQSMLGQVATP